METAGGLILIIGAILAAIFVAKKLQPAQEGDLDPPIPVGPNVPAVPVVPLSVQDIIRDAALGAGEDAALMLAVAKAESSFNPLAINPSDPSYGLFQIQLFWLKEFGFPSPTPGKDASDPTKNVLFDAATASDVAARILHYFQMRVNPNTGSYFQFPQDIDIYNVGEPKWRKGTRNLAYRDKVTKYYREFGGLA